MTKQELLSEDKLTAACNEMQDGDGVYVHPGFLSLNVVEKMRSLILKYEDDEYGSVRRLLNKSPLFEDIICAPLIEQVCSRLFSDEYRLSAFGARNIYPQATIDLRHTRVSSPHIDYPYRSVIGKNEGKSCKLFGAALGVQIIIPLVEFSKEMGATSYIPGSQKWYRQPDAAEYALCEEQGKTARLFLNAGDLAMWSGPLWHHACQNLTSQTRTTITMLFTPSYIRPAESMKEQYVNGRGTNFRKSTRTILGLDDFFPATYHDPNLIK